MSQAGTYINDLVSKAAGLLANEVSSQISLSDKARLWAAYDDRVPGGDSYTRFIRDYMQEAITHGPFSAREQFSFWVPRISAKGLDKEYATIFVGALAKLIKEKAIPPEILDPKNNPPPKNLESETWYEKLLKGSGKYLLIGVGIYAFAGGLGKGLGMRSFSKKKKES